MRGHKGTSLTEGADGRLMLWFGDAGPLNKLRVWALLRLRYRFHRERKRIIGAGESIAPDYVRDDLRLQAGAEESPGFYPSSASAEGDAFLRQLAARLA